MQTVSHGYRGEAVKEVQRRLGITVDGIFGTQTLEAVKQFQRNKGLKVDGVVGPDTWAALLGQGSTGSVPETVVSTGGGLIDKVIGVALIYGIFQVLKRVF